MGYMETFTLEIMDGTHQCQCERALVATKKSLPRRTRFLAAFIMTGAAISKGSDHPEAVSFRGNDPFDPLEPKKKDRP
jgi:hypothetical protein